MEQAEPLSQMTQMTQVMHLMKRDNDPGFESLDKRYPEPDKFRAYIWSDELDIIDWLELDFPRLVADTKCLDISAVKTLVVIAAIDLVDLIDSTNDSASTTTVNHLNSKVVDAEFKQNSTAG